MLYAIPYLFFLLFLSLLVCWEFFLKKNNITNITEIRIVTWIGFLLFFGFRGFVNTDCLSYYPFFQNLKTIWDGIPYEQILSGYDWEPGFITTVYLFKSIIPNYHVWIVIWLIIVLSALDFLFLRCVKYYSLAFLLFFVFGGYGIITNLMRASIALCIFLFSIPYLVAGKWKRFICLNVFGCLFHISSLVYILSYPILRKRIPIPILISIFVIVLGCNIAGIDFSNVFNFFAQISSFERVTLLVDRYSDTEANSLFSIGNLERFGTYMLVCLFYDKIANETKSNKVFLNAYIIYFVCFYAFFKIGDVAQRLSGLFIFSYWILYNKIYQYLMLKSRKTFLFFILILYSILKTVSGMSMPCHQYKNILWENEAFEEATKRITL